MLFSYIFFLVKHAIALQHTCYKSPRVKCARFSPTSPSPPPLAHARTMPAGQKGFGSGATNPRARAADALMQPAPDAAAAG